MPVPREEFGNAPRRVVSEAGEHVGEVGLRVETIELGAFDQRIDCGGTAAAGIGAGEQIIFAANGNRRFILPISGRRSKSTIAGTRCMDAGFGGSMSELYAACDGGALIAVSNATGKCRAQRPLAGPPDATFFNPASGLVHVEIEEPRQIQTIDPRTGTNTCFTTASGAPTTALVPPDHLYVFSPYHRGVLDLIAASGAPHSGICKA